MQVFLNEGISPQGWYTTTVSQLYPSKRLEALYRRPQRLMFLRWCYARSRVVLGQAPFHTWAFLFEPRVSIGP